MRETKNLAFFNIQRPKKDIEKTKEEMTNR